MDASVNSTLPSSRVWHSQTLEPGAPVTSTLPNDEAQIQPPRTRTETAIHRLPMEIWIAVCNALRRLDLIDFTKEENPFKKGHRELYRRTINKNRPDPIITAVSILQLSHTCRYLHKVTSPCLLETIRLIPPLDGDVESRYHSLILQVTSLQSNSNQRLQHVRGFAVALPPNFVNAKPDHASDIRHQICHLLTRFPNLRHLTFVGVKLDVPLMHGILALPLEHLWLWLAEPDDPITDHSFISTTTPKIKLRSLVLKAASEGRPRHRLRPSLPHNWTSELIGTAMQELSFDDSVLIPPFLPVLPDLEVLEGPDILCRHLVTPSMLCRLLSKTPNLKEAAFPGPADRGSPSDAFPALSRLQRAVCDHSWLSPFIPGRPTTTVQVFCDYRRSLQELFNILHKSSVPIRDLTLTYGTLFGFWSEIRWSPRDLEPIARYFPELEILRLDINDPKMAGLQDTLLHISQLQKLRIVSVHVVGSGPPDEVWQESKLREFLGLTKSPVLERVGFAEKCEWKLEETGLWTLWQRGRMVRSLSL